MSANCGELYSDLPEVWVLTQMRGFIEFAKGKLWGSLSGVAIDLGLRYTATAVGSQMSYA